ncbi:MAG: hypothetical protein KDA66_16080, partial [Planctomycetaceae bacterium]|nr:hypothetical protein [Planctomycetaceae bacterium]
NFTVQYSSTNDPMVERWLSVLAHDMDGDTLTYSSWGTNGTFHWTGTEYSPSPTPYTLSASVSDGNGGTDDTTIFLTVLPEAANNPPEFIGDDGVQAYQLTDDTYALGSDDLGMVSVYAEDLEYDYITYFLDGAYTIIRNGVPESFASGNPFMVHYGGVIDIYGPYVLEPGATYEFTAYASDEQYLDLLNPDMSRTDDATVSITVLNHAPEFISDVDTAAAAGQAYAGAGDALVQNDDEFHFFSTAPILNGGTFSKMLPAEDADGDPLTWTLVNPPQGFTIVQATGELKYSGDATPGQTLTATAKVSSADGEDDASIEIHVVGLSSLNYTETAKVKRDNGTFSDVITGAYYNGVEWKPGDAAPFVHKMGAKVEVQPQLVGVPDGFVYTLKGDAAADYLDFTLFGEIYDSSTASPKITAAAPLPALMQQIETPISWSIIVDGETLSLGDTQNKIFVTFDKPASGVIVTETRIDWITTKTTKPDDGPANLPTAYDYVERMHLAQGGRFDLRRHPPTTWALLDDDPDGNPYKGQCIDQINLLKEAVWMAGLRYKDPAAVNGQQSQPAGQIRYVYPRSNASIKGQDLVSSTHRL